MSAIRTFAPLSRACLSKLITRDLPRLSIGTVSQRGIGTFVNSSSSTTVHSRKEFTPKFGHVKYYSKMSSQNVVTIEELLDEGKNGGSLIIDVRELEEINETGVIPGGVNVPLGTLEKAIQCSAAEFKSLYGVDKPDKDGKIILSCRSGKRSSMAYDKLQALGYTNLWNFSGGWLGYEKYRNEHPS